MINSKFIQRFGLLMILTLLLSSKSFSQINLKGRVFSTLYSTSCKELTDGGCIINTYCKLRFDKDTVTVFYESEADCTPKEKEKLYEKSSEKVYQWYASKKTIHLKDFDGFGTLTFSNGNLVGKKYPSDKSNNIEFNEEPQD